MVSIQSFLWSGLLGFVLKNDAKMREKCYFNSQIKTSGAYTITPFMAVISAAVKVSAFVTAMLV